MKALTLLISTVVIVATLTAQQEGGHSHQFRPSTLVTDVLPEQDITLTFHVTSDLATAIRNDQLDSGELKLTKTTSGSYQIPAPDLAGQILYRLNQIYFPQVTKAYATASLKQVQDTAASAQKAAEAEVKTRGTAIRK